jgi:hypothetical protein
MRDWTVNRNLHSLIRITNSKEIAVLLMTMRTILQWPYNIDRYTKECEMKTFSKLNIINFEVRWKVKNYIIVCTESRYAKRYDIISILFILYVQTHGTTVKITHLFPMQMQKKSSRLVKPSQRNLRTYVKKKDGETYIHVELRYTLFHF